MPSSNVGLKSNPSRRIKSFARRVVMRDAACALYLPNGQSVAVFNNYELGRPCGRYSWPARIPPPALDAGTAAMIVNTGPILIALGAGVFLGEGIPRWLAIGAGLPSSGRS